MSREDMPKWAETATLAIMLVVLSGLCLFVLTGMFLALKAWINP